MVIRRAGAFGYFLIGSVLIIASSPMAGTPVKIFSDLTGTATPGGYIVGQYGSYPPINSYVIGAAFTPVGSNYTLDQIQALLSFSSGTNNMIIRVYTDVGGVPGSLLESWNLVNVLVSAPQIVALNSALHPTLTAGHQYWITAGMADPTSVGVWWINGIGVPCCSTPAELQGIGVHSLNGGPFAPSPGALTTLGFQAFAVTGDVVGGPAAVSTYQLTGTLQWNPTSGADLISGNGKPIIMTVDITNPSGTPIVDPNGTREDYSGTGTLQIGSMTVLLSGTATAFFHSNSHSGDVTNFFLFPSSGTPAFYLPAVNFSGDINATLSPPPVYPPNVSFVGTSMVVPGPVGTPNAVYTITNSTFSSEPSTPVPCTFSLSPAGQSFAPSGGLSSFAVNTAATCGWTPVPSSGWITILPSGSTGTGKVNYAVEANNSPSGRSGFISVGGQQYGISELGFGCSYSIGPTFASPSDVGGDVSVSVSTPAGCSWTAVSNVSWVTVKSGASVSGGGVVVLDVARNTGPTRSATVTIAGQTFTINQGAGACGALDVTSQVSVTRSQLIPIPFSTEYSQSITVRNNSGSLINGPVYVVLLGEPTHYGYPNDSFLIGGGAMTTCFSSQGDYLVLVAGGLINGQAGGVAEVWITQPFGRVQYTTKVLSGTPSH